MRIALAANDHLLSRYLLQRLVADLPEGVTLSLVLHETTPYAWKTKFLRFVKHASPNFIRGLATNPYWRLRFLEKRAFRFEHALLFDRGEATLPEGVEVVKVAHTGDQKSRKALKKHNIGILLIFGVLPVDTAFLKIVPVTLGLHFGLLPDFRGLHSQIWAAARGERQGLAVTLHHVTDKIGGGRVLETRSIATSPLLSLTALRALSVQAGAEMMLDFLEHTLLEQFIRDIATENPPEATCLPPVLKPTPLWQRFLAARQLRRWRGKNLRSH